MKQDKYVNNWSQKIELIVKTYSTKKLKETKIMTDKILSRSKKNIRIIKCFIEITEQLKKVRRGNVKYLATKKRSKYSKKVSDQRKNKKTSCKTQRSTTRLHNLSEN